MKTCTVCKEKKNEEDFRKWSNICKICANKKSKETKITKHNLALKELKPMKCIKCKSIKSATEFNTGQDWCKECQKAYNEINKERAHALNKQNYENNKDAYIKRASARNPEDVKNYKRKYTVSIKGKENRKIHKYEHERELGYAPLNKPFLGSDFHHLLYTNNINEKNNNIGIYIPVELHASVRHSRKTGKNLKEINILATKWYLDNTPKDKQDIRIRTLYSSYLLLPSPKWD